MNVETHIKGHTIRFNFSEGLNYFKGNGFTIEYDTDISDTPRHLANYLCAILMQDIYSWNSGEAVFDELTQRELESANYHIRLNAKSHGCGGCERGYKKMLDHVPCLTVKADRIVDDDGFDDAGTVLTSNGMGKEGIGVACLAKEVNDGEVRCFTVGNEYSRLGHGLWEERQRAAHAFYKAEDLDSNLVLTDWFKSQTGPVNSGFYPYVYGLILARHYGAKTILSGTGIHVNKRRLSDGALYCPGESIFSWSSIGEATGITLTSPLTAMTGYMNQKLLLDRYPQHWRLQRSCMYGHPWCCRCTKCNRKSLYMMAAGRDPRTVGLDFYEKRHLHLETYMECLDTVTNIVAKVENREYERWVEQLNKSALYLPGWRRSRVADILREHFDVYDYDPSCDEQGYACTPSEWRGWMEKGLA